MQQKLSEVIYGQGHENVRATHRTTLEITKDLHLSKAGDCIIVVGADKAASDLSHGFKELLRRPGAKLTVTLEASGITEQVTAWGSPYLLLRHETDIVIRKSTYVCDRTIAIHADKAANDLSRRLVEVLRNPHQQVKVTLTVSI